MMYMLSTLLPTQRPCFCLGKVLLTFFLGISTLEVYADARIWYVDVASPAVSPDGSSWEAAFTSIQHAVDAAVKQGISETECAEVWVAEGVYTGIGGRSELGDCVLFMRENVHLYGGFSGNETDRAKRNWEQHKTVIDGEKRRRCVWGDSNGTLDGFVACNGYASKDPKSNSDKTGCGAGMFISNALLTVTNCSFIENIAETSGGGLYIEVHSIKKTPPTLTNCRFIQNSARIAGGGVGKGNKAVCLVNCTFIKNTAGQGGGGAVGNCLLDSTFIKNTVGRGVRGMPGESTIKESLFIENKAQGHGGAINVGAATNCIFEGNVAEGNGGGLCNGIATSCIFIDNTAQIDGGGICWGDAVDSTFISNKTQRHGGGMLDGSAKNCRFKSNSAKRNGGGLCNGVATNCVFIDNTAHKNGGGMCWSGAVNSTFFGNRAQGNGGGIYDRYSVFLTNCIVWGNSAEKEGQAIYPVHAEAPRVTYSCIEGGYTGEGNIDTPPLFVNPGEGDVSLQADSPCINAGTSKDAPTTDIQGASRPQGNGVDIGAYEWSGDKTK